MDTPVPDAVVRRPVRALRTATVTSLVTLGLVVTAGATSAASPVPSGARATMTRTVMSSDSYEAKVELYVNKKRAAHGLRPLRFESCTDLTAERWAERIASTGEVVHQGSGAIIDACHLSYAGETLGRGGFGPRRLLRTWMRSPLHRAVVLSPLARQIGVGSHLDGSGRWVTSASFTRR